MLCEADGYSGQNRYQIHPVKTEVVSLSNASNEDLKWTLGENVLTLSDKTVHLGLTRELKIEFPWLDGHLIHLLILGCMEPTD